MVPWLRRFSEQALKNQDRTLPMLAQHWARVCRTAQGKSHTQSRRDCTRLIIVIAALLSDEQLEWFANFYFRLAALGSAKQTDKPNVTLSLKI